MNDGRYRYPTEREYCRLKGFDDNDFDLMLEIFPINPHCRSSTLYVLASDIIVVQVLAIFEVIMNEDYRTDLVTNDNGQLQLIC